MANICLRCSEPAAVGRAYCMKHLTSAHAIPPKKPGRRGKGSKGRRRNDTFYSTKKWRTISKQFLLDNPWCVCCELQGKLTPAKHVDHILPRLIFPTREYTQSNFQALCVSCHTRKTAKDSIGIFMDYKNRKAYNHNQNQYESISEAVNISKG